MKTQEIKDVRLVIKIDNKKPVELIDLTKSLVSIANQFSQYVTKEGVSKEEREAKLYLKEIKTGSIIVELIEYATIGMLPFVENVNTIVGFAENLKKAIKYYLNNEGENPQFSINDLRDISSIVNPIAKDNASQLFINTTINGNVELTINLNSTEANAIQNKIKQEVLDLRLEEVLKDNYDKVAMKLFQARSDIKSKLGNKGTIEELNEKPLNIIFENEELKEQILQSETNPLKSIFIVDVKIITIDNKPAIFKILKLHEKFEID